MIELILSIGGEIFTTPFTSSTMDNYIISGSPLFPTSLQGRTVITTENDIEHIIREIKVKNDHKKIFILGVDKKQLFERYQHLITKLHIYLYKNQKHHLLSSDNEDYKIESIQQFEHFTYYTLVPIYKGEIQYLSLLENVLDHGSETFGRNGNVTSSFTNHLSFNLQHGFPLLTTKKMFFRGIVEELLFFLRGDTDTKILENKGVNIWKGNTSKEFIKQRGLPYAEGEMGPMYGYQWRKYGATYKSDEKGLDQLLNVIELIKKDPKSRRILLSDFNPIQAHEGVLFPCHSIIIQFFVEDGYLDMYCYNRSSDLFLGLPFNIASSSLLLCIVAKMTRLVPRNFNLSLGDCHIYEDHKDAVSEQLSRVPKGFPTVNIKDFNTIEELTYEHFNLVGYTSHDSIKAKMIA